MLKSIIGTGYSPNNVDAETKSCLDGRLTVISHENQHQELVVVSQRNIIITPKHNAFTPAKDILMALKVYTV